MRTAAPGAFGLISRVWPVSARMGLSGRPPAPDAGASGTAPCDARILGLAALFAAGLRAGRFTSAADVAVR